MPRVPVVEIWRKEIEPDTLASPPSPPITPNVTPDKPKPKPDPKPKPKAKVAGKSPKTTPGPPGSSGRDHPKTWTPAEKLKLYDIVVKKGASRNSFEGQFEGRIASQCYITW